ncbi:SgcJ/EcaC family oxidoreductase [Pseudophaeobacter sp.]|uniref:YybH family protein n=1 Tax=Pseudophaeobacter sp. TaxID=1971739 RepID=UPI0032981AD9
MTLPQSPEEIPVQFATAWNARDAEALAALFVEDADFVNVVGLWWHNRRDIERAHAYGLRVIFDQSTLRAGGISIRALGEGHAVVHCRWHLTGQRDPKGALLGERTTVMVFVAQKTPSGWQVVAAQNTDVIPGSETLGIKPEGAEALKYSES